MKTWKKQFRAHNYQVRNIDFPRDTYIAELQVNDTHGRVKVVFVRKDTSVLQGTLFITPKPEGVTLQDYP